MQDIHTLILAAGKGSRMGGHLPKVLYPVGGVPMLRHVIDTASQLSNNISVLIGDDMRNVSDAAAPHRCIIQHDRLGTGHGVKVALPFLPDDGLLVVLYGDSPLISVQTLRTMIDKMQGNAVCVLGFDCDDLSLPYGRLQVDGDHLLGIVEYIEASDALKQSPLCNAGMMVLDLAQTSKIIEALPLHQPKGEYYLTDVPSLAVKAGLSCAWHRGDAVEAMGANTIHELQGLEATFQAAKRTQMLQNGVMMPDAAAVHFHYDTKIGRGTTVHPYVVFGAGVSIGENCNIYSFSHMEGASIANNANIGPHARLRPGAVLDEGVKIGNFVEVKKSRLQAGAKVNHLSYVGDADVGKAANIGAGTITCNYDGKNKHKTIIGANAFIGSNTALVAPVRIGANALIGAGSVITQDVADSALAIARGRQVEKSRT